MRITYDTILKDTEPRLRTKSLVVKLPLRQADLALAKRLVRYVNDSRDDEKADKYNLRPAVGLAAPQVGAFIQMIVVMVDHDEETKLYCLANPKIIAHSVQAAALKTGEGCLSVEQEHPGYVIRHARVTIKAYDIFEMEEVIIKESGYTAIVLQHEIDHLNGILFYDRINNADPWDAPENLLIIE